LGGAGRDCEAIQMVINNDVGDAVVYRLHGVLVCVHHGPGVVSGERGGRAQCPRVDGRVEPGFQAGAVGRIRHVFVGRDRHIFAVDAQQCVAGAGGGLVPARPPDQLGRVHPGRQTGQLDTELRNVELGGMSRERTQQ